MIVGQRQSKRFILGLVPARDNVEPAAPMSDLVERCDLLGDNDRVVGCRMDGGDHRDSPGRSQQPGSPGYGFQHVPVEIGFTAVTDPARNRQHEINACIVEQSCEFEVAVPAGVPAFGDTGYRHPAGAIGGKGAQLKVIFPEHPVFDRCHYPPFLKPIGVNALGLK